MRDGTVSQEALDVGLKERSKISRKHGEDREDPEGPEPELRGGVNIGKDAQEQGESRGFGSRGKERGNGSGSAFVNVRSPNLERRSGDLEAQADEDEGEAELEHGARGIGGIHFQEIRCAGDSVNQRDAVEKKGRGKRAEKEILHRGFAGFQCVAAVAGEDVAGDGAHLEADERGEEFLRGGENAHARSGEEDERVEFRILEPFTLEIGGRAENNEYGHQADEMAEEDAERIGGDKAGEGRAGIMDRIKVPDDSAKRSDDRNRR